MKVYIKTRDDGDKLKVMHIVTGDIVKNKSDVNNVVIKIDKIIISFGNNKETIYPKVGMDIDAPGFSLNLTINEIYEKVIMMIFDDRFDYKNNREFTIYN